MRRFWMSLACLLVSVWVADADVLYENTTMRGDPERFADSDYEFGEEIVMLGAGTYVLTNFQFEYYGYGSSFDNGQVSVTLRLYRNDGPLVTTGAYSPETVLYTAAPFTIPATGPAGSVIEYAGLAVSVPRNFTWAVDFTGLSGGGVGLQSAGLDLYGVPTVGLTYDDYWEHSSSNGGWVLRIPLPGQPPINFGCKAQGIYTGIPVVLTQPVGGSACPGDTVQLSVAALAGTPLSYQWYKDATPVSGATSSNLTLAGLTLAQFGNYTVRVSNFAGSTTSAVAVVSLKPVPVITSHPVGVNACPGSTVVLSVSATSVVPLSYQWFKGGNPISGATSSSLTLPGVSATDAGNYQVRVRNCAGDTLSTMAVVAVQTIVPMTGIVVYDNSSFRSSPARFTQQDFEFGDEIVLEGNGTYTLTQFSFEYFGYGSDFNNGKVRVRVHLYRNDGLAGAPGTRIYDSGQFTVPATGDAGSVVTFQGLSVAVPKNFTWTVDFNGIGNGSGGGIQAGGLDLYSPPTVGYNYDDYWERSGSGQSWVLRGPLPGQPPVNFGARAEATVTGTPYVTQQPASVVADRGDRVTLAAQAAGSTPPVYQWFLGNTPLPGATNLTLIIPFVDTVHVGTYKLQVTTCLGSVFSKSVTVSLRDPGQTSPTLHVVPGAPGTVVASWTSFYGPGWRLQQAAALSTPSTWGNVSGTPTLADGVYSLILPTSGAARFFRLVNP